MFGKGKKSEGLFKRSGADEVVKVSVGLAFLEGPMKETIEKYVRALYDQDISELPKEKLDPVFYDLAVQSIKKDAERVRRTCETVTVVRFYRMARENYDMVKMINVTYDVLYEVTGTCNGRDIEDSQRKVFTFRKDQRLGWLLYNSEPYFVKE